MYKSTDYAALIHKNARRVGELHARIHETLKSRSSSAGRAIWEQACAEFHSSYDALAFPGGYSAGLQKIAQNNLEAIEAALVFLELRPYFFRSGYMRKKLMRLIKRAPLNNQQALRLAVVVEAQKQWRAMAQQGAAPDPHASASLRRGVG